MSETKYFGLVSTVKDEKSIINGLNSFLTTLDRTTSKTKNKSLLESYLPFEFKHFYWNLNKSTGTFLAIFPNCDLRGVWIHEDNKECAWFAKVIYHRDYPGYDEKNSPAFIHNALTSTGCELLELSLNPIFESKDS